MLFTKNLDKRDAKSHSSLACDLSLVFLWVIVGLCAGGARHSLHQNDCCWHRERSESRIYGEMSTTTVVESTRSGSMKD